MLTKDFLHFYAPSPLFAQNCAIINLNIKKRKKEAHELHELTRMMRYWGDGVMGYWGNGLAPFGQILLCDLCALCG